MQLSYTVLALGALGLQCALAQPHRHHHKHKRGHADSVQARDYVDYSNPDLYESVDWSSVFSQAAVATPVASPPETSNLAVSIPTAAPPAVGPTPSEEDDTPKDDPEKEHPPQKADEPKYVQNEEKKPKKAEEKQPSYEGQRPSKDFGDRTDPIDDGNQDHYIGNVGRPYGSNMILIDESERRHYKYTITLTNIEDAPTKYILWNKSGKDGRPQSGMGSEPNLKFTIGAQESQVIAFDENSQVSFSRDCERNVLGGNLPDCTWGEADFGDLRNGGWSGYDCSSIPNSQGNVGHCRISCEGAKTSSDKENSFVSAAQTNAGGSLAPGPVAFYAEL